MMLFSNRGNSILLVRHAIVSVLSAFVEYSSFLILLSFFKVPLLISILISYGMAYLVGLTFHSFFTFEVGGIDFWRGLRFFLQCCFILLIGGVLLIKMLKVGIPAYLAKAIQLAFTFVINFMIGRYVTFRG